MNRVPRALAIITPLVLIVSVLSTAPAWAQGSTAELNGRVTDSSGAVLPGVTVTVTQTATGLQRTAVTDGSGVYLITNLPTGPYRLEVSLQGFRGYVQTGIVLTVGATPTINAVLALGSLEETVTVDAAAPLVDVRSAGISSVVENERILELPLQGRQVTDLLVLAGAAVQTATGTSRSAPGGVRISVGGGLETGVAYVLDGADHNNQQENINYALPFPDALQEFRVATSGLTAQNGVKSGASVNAVTKSGTNRFAGNGFEFLRHHRFNATNPFAARGPDGKRRDDGLKRNQFGGTLGGPIVQDKLFFFGGYQGTATRTTPRSFIARVPTAQMLTGDFTTFTSPRCQGGRQVNLRAPYVNNRLDPSLLSPAALKISAKLPASTDPCGEITYGIGSDSDEHQALGRIDFQARSNLSFFGRYFIQKFTKAPGYAGGDDNILKSSGQGTDAMLHAVNIGTTSVFGASTVNALRFALNKSKVDNNQNPFFCPSDVGINVYCYEPHFMVLTVTGGFDLYPANQSEALFFNDSYNVSDDLTIVRGNHQFGFGGNVRYWKGDYTSSSRANGSWRITGSNTGSGLADFLAGRITTLEQGNLNRLIVNNTYIGAYGQDSWRASNRVTINAGLRWEPFLGQNLENDAISIWVQDNFDKGVVSNRFPLAPAGLLWPGDPGFPPRQTGLNIQWWNLSPRAGVAWDVHGDGRLAVRSSYAMAYDFMAGEFHNINSGAPPFGNRSTQTNPSGGLDDPYSDAPGGNPHPLVSGGVDTPFVKAGGYGSMDPNLNSPRVQTWNVTIEQQLGTDWGVSASYLGSYSDRLWGQVALNPGVFLGEGPCVINGVSYRVCSTDANLQQRRVLSLKNPAVGQFIGGLDLNTDVGYQKFRGLKLSAQRRTATGLSLNGSYTLGRCFGLQSQARFNQTSGGYTDPEHPEFDAGPCIQDRRHLATLTLGYETPDVGGAALRAIASHWRVSGIVSARSGDRLNIDSGRDNAKSGIRTQRPNQVSDNIYGAKTLLNYFNRDAFAQPAIGTLGDFEYNGAVGPNFWNVNLALSKLIAVSGAQRMELRLEAFNLLNTFNWGNPAANFNSGQFGRITTMAGEPRIMQFGIKYDF